MNESAVPSRADTLEVKTDVLVIGGGPAALWAALTAKAEGARVLLVDKGFAGASGVAAAATAGHWWIAPERREEEMAQRDAVGENLSERSWMERVLEETWRRWPEVGANLGYPGGRFPGIGRNARDDGAMLCQGPVYLREMRRRVSHSGVRILDHAPALELLVDAEGAVCGAAGVQRQKGRPWRALAGAVILATGGCCFRSGALGSNVDTGDGYLMAAEVGARLSGMEFSNYYGIVQKGGSMDKNGFYGSATFSDADGNVIATGFAGGGTRPVGGGKTWLFEEALNGPVFAIFDLVPKEAWANMRAQMPNFFMAMDRDGIDPLTQRFEIEYILEGTTRGTGGVRVADDSCWSGVPGLWVAGDAASREFIVGSASGAGAPNAAFTIGSGTWSGRAATAHALSVRAGVGAANATPAGRVGLRPTATSLPEGTWRDISGAIQGEILPMEKNGFRSAEPMRRSIEVLDDLWQEASAGLIGYSPREQVWARETAAMLACARWAYTAAHERTESRGMHKRTDFREQDPAQRQRLVLSGTDDIYVEKAPIDDPFVPYAEDDLVAVAA